MMKRFLRRILKDRRRDRRNEIVISVDYSAKDGPVHLFLKTSNISRGGAFIETSKPLPPGSEIELAFILPTAKDDPLALPTKVSCRAVIMHSYEGGKAKRKGMGVKFIDLSDDGWKKVESFIKAKEAKRQTASVLIASMPDIKEMSLSEEKAKELAEAQKELAKEIELFSDEEQ